MANVGVEDVKRSFGRCCLKPDFLDTFYEIFLVSAPEIPGMFRHTDFVKQKKMLQNSLNMLISYALGNQLVESYLSHIAERHARNELNVAPKLYDYWLDSLISAVEKHDERYTPELGEAWRRVMAPGIAFMQQAY